MPADDSHEISCLICYFEKKKQQNLKLSSAANYRWRFKGQMAIKGGIYCDFDYFKPSKYSPFTDIQSLNLLVQSFKAFSFSGTPLERLSVAAPNF